tara:strand:- start:377 stop:730 length:354 start_codon:yes stop_codon:yes gene_type:complete
MIEIKLLAWISGSLVIFFLCVFVFLIQVKIDRWNQKKISPLPLEGFLTISSFFAVLSGLTILFTALFEILVFAPLNALIASLLISFTTGLPMWFAVRRLLEDIQAGQLKEIVPGEFE